MSVLHAEGASPAELRRGVVAAEVYFATHGLNAVDSLDASRSRTRTSACRASNCPPTKRTYGTTGTRPRWWQRPPAAAPALEPQPVCLACQAQRLELKAA